MLFLRQRNQGNRLQRWSDTPEIYFFLRKDNATPKNKTLFQAPTKNRHGHQTRAHYGDTSFCKPLKCLIY